MGSSVGKGLLTQWWMSTEQVLVPPRYRPRQQQNVSAQQPQVCVDMSHYRRRRRALPRPRRLAFNNADALADSPCPCKRVCVLL